VRCQAQAILTEGDWSFVLFYQRVADQYVNQTPMGIKDSPPLVTPRMEGYEAVLRVYGYPKDQWVWLVDLAREFDSWVKNKRRVVQFMDSLGYRWDDVRMEDVISGTG
jgi:hypothetical protein